MAQYVNSLLLCQHAHLWADAQRHREKPGMVVCISNLGLEGKDRRLPVLAAQSI